MKKFPTQCPHDCPHYAAFDMSMDDWTNICRLIPAQVDDCDTDYISYPCPLEENNELER